MKLFFDTETTGKYNFGAGVGHPTQPYLVQLAAILTDDAGKERAAFHTIIKPDGWTVPLEAAQIHGISTEIAESCGLPLAEAMSCFYGLASIADELVAHNSAFDVAVLSTVFARLQLTGFQSLFTDKRITCTMLGSTDFCRIPGRRGYKWPSLQEAHCHFYGQRFDGAHDAMADTRACLRVAFALKGNPLDLAASPSRR